MKTKESNTATMEPPAAEPEKRNGNGDTGSELDALRPQGKSGVTVTDTGPFQNWLDSARFDHLYRVAQVFAGSQMVPKHFQGHPYDCLIACQMAIRLEVDPFMFMQNTYVIGGRPAMEAKLVIALVNQRGPFKGPIQWKFSGEGKDRKCTAYAVHEKTDERCEVDVTWEMATKEGWTSRSGSKWQTMPDQMFRYRSATFLARLFCPEVLMGMLTTDEAEDLPPIIDVKVKDDRPVIDKLTEELNGGKSDTPAEEEAVIAKTNPEASFATPDAPDAMAPPDSLLPDDNESNTEAFKK